MFYQLFSLVESICEAAIQIQERTFKIHTNDKLHLEHDKSYHYQPIDPGVQIGRYFISDQTFSLLQIYPFNSLITLQKGSKDMDIFIVECSPYLSDGNGRISDLLILILQLRDFVQRQRRM